MISIDHVTMKFGRATAVDDACLSLQPGDSVALWGANGAGKTTLIRCVLGLLRYSGRVTIGGHDARTDGKAARMLIGYVPQELSFHDDLGVGEAVAFFARLKGLGRVNVTQALEGVGLPGQAAKRVRELSGGMKQRLALAIALLGSPPVLVLDEVTASLDAVGREEYVSLLARLAHSGRTLLFASHRPEEVGTLARRVCVMERARIVRASPVSEFLDSLGRGSMLHLHMPLERRGPAIRALRGRGFQPCTNGIGIVVPLRGESRAAPFRILAESHIAVDDFDLIDRAAPISEQAPRTEAHP